MKLDEAIAFAKRHFPTGRDYSVALRRDLWEELGLEMAMRDMHAPIPAWPWHLQIRNVRIRPKGVA